MGAGELVVVVDAAHPESPNACQLVRVVHLPIRVTATVERVDEVEPMCGHSRASLRALLGQVELGWVGVG